MSFFDHALDVVLEHEGGLVDHPSDPGGLTNLGISLKFGKTIGLTAADIRAMTRERAAEIYRQHFWNPVRGDELPWGISLCAFDCAVNQGVGAAIRLLQQAAGVSVDGQFGPKTLAAAVSSARPRQAVAKEFMALRALRYAATGGFDTFGRGWMRRLMDVAFKAAQEK